MIEMKTLTIGETTYEIVDETAREAIAALEENGGTGGSADAVLYTEQTLTEEQKAQARANIGAAAAGEIGSGCSADAETIAEITRNMERVSVYVDGSVNLVDQDACVFGYVTCGGEVYESSALKYTPHIHVSEGDIIRFYRLENVTTGAVELKGIRYVTAYDADGNGVTDSGVNNSSAAVFTYTVPAGIDSIVLSFPNVYVWCFTRNTEITEYVPYDPNAVSGEVVSYVAKPAFVGMASETKPGLVRMWTEELDGETVLYISTEEV